MSDGWLSPPTIVAAIVGIITAFGVFITWRVFVWQRAGEKPILTCDVSADKDYRDWIIVAISLENPGSTPWELRRLTLKRGAEGIEDHHPVFDTRGGYRFSEEAALEHKAREVRLARNLGSSGSQISMFNRTTRLDVTWFRIYVFRPSIRSHKLSMRLSLLSKEAVQRKMTIAIVRQLEAETSAATD